MPLAISGCNGNAQKNPTEEAAMVTVGTSTKKQTAVISFGGRWPLAFQLRMLTITGLLSSTPIPRRKP